MPRATTDRFSRAHQPSAKASSSKSSHAESSSSAARNPIFNTEQFSQHILKNPQIAQDIVDKANIKPTDKVLEVGPGTGNLTVRILEKARHCTAVETDLRMAAELTKRTWSPEQRKLHLIIGDFVKAELPYFDVCISNTPYQISSPLIFKLLSHRPLPRVCILMFQREFALRLVAQPDSSLWSRLSANVQLYAGVNLAMNSSVVGVVPKDPPPPVRFEEFDGLRRIISSRRNKTVYGNFMAKGVVEMLEKNWKMWCSETNKMIEDDDSMMMKARIEAVLTETGHSENRAAKMSIDDLLKLLSAFHDIGVHFA
ncbi:S-adenosyl-L-methionine-dependent methyltransferase [Mycena floridula]|nr:S-adenosyl-L-methionine-dependent methyltransferase [Mycena floridula]